MPELPQRRRPDNELIEWFTISYRTIVGVAVVAVMLLAAAAYFYFFAGQSGTAGPASPPPAQPAAARFTGIEGSVRVKAVGTFEWVAADTHTLLRRGDLVRTSAGATAEISFGDGTTVQMRPDSLLSIEETGGDPATRQRRVAVGLSSGDVSYNRSAAGGSTQVSTPTVKLTHGGAGGGGLSVAETGETDVRVFSGEAARLETRSGASVELQASEGVRIDAAGKAGAKTALPAVPLLLAPPHQTEIAYLDPSRGTTLLAWKVVPGAQEYRVMLDYSTHFNRPLVDQRLRENQVSLRGLEPGRYYWKVAAVAKDGVEGSFSALSAFSIARPTARAGVPPPPLTVASLEVRNNILQIKGRSEPGASVTVNGQRVEVQADGSFNEFVTLDKAGAQVVEIRAVGLNGGVMVKRQSVVVAGI